MPNIYVSPLLFMFLGMGSSWNNGGRDLVSEPDHPEESFLMDSKSPSLLVAEKTLLDLERDLIDPELFESYTLTGKM